MGRSFSCFGRRLSVDNYPKPALTLGGELDGLTRVTRVAQSWRELQALLVTAADEADEAAAAALRYSRAVIVLEGQTHSQFCSGVNISNFGAKDGCPAVGWPAAQAAIGAAVSAFLSAAPFRAAATDAAEVAAAEAALDAGMAYTETLVAGYLAAQDEEASAWCGAAQMAELAASGVAGATSACAVDVTTCGNFASFDVTSPSVAVDGDDSCAVVAVDETSTPLNPTDVSTTDQAANEIDCKVATAAALAAALGGDAAAANATTCEARNAAAIAAAATLVSDATAARYAAVGQPFATQADVEYSTGVTWQAASLTFDTKGDQVVLGAPRLTVDADAGGSYAGQQLCKFVPPSRVIEYMMVDGLPKYDDDAC